MDTTPTLEQRAESYGVKLNRSRGKSYASITLDGEDITFDGPDAEGVLNDAIAYADIHNSGGLFTVDYDEAADEHTVTIAGTGEAFADASPAEAFRQAQEAHDENMRKEQEAEAARAAQAAPEKPKRSRAKKDPALDASGNLRPTQAEADAAPTPLATELGEEGWDKPADFTPPAPQGLPSDQLIQGFDAIINGLVLIRDGIKAFNNGA